MAETVLSISDLDIAYGATTVVRDVSLAVSEGEFVSLLGPSGCGKTTILRTVAGFIPAARGRITLEGQDITHEPPERRDIGIVFQNYALFPTMTAYENIAFGLRVAGTRQAELNRKVSKIAEVAGILEHLDKKPANMSGGQQQRVAIARALILGSRVLLFDEPLSNLDAKVRVNMRREIKRLQSDIGFTALFVTHDQEEALSMSDRVVVLRDGEIEQVGTGRELYGAPANPFICQFIGEANHLPPALVGRMTDLTESAEVFVRYEDVILSPGGSSGIEARVAHVEYLGSITRIECDVEDHTLSTVVRNHETPAALAKGDVVRLTIRDDAAHVFASTGR